MELVNFGLLALLSSYGVICSPRRLLPAIQSPQILHSSLLINMTVQLCTTNQTETRVKSGERDCQSYTARQLSFAYLSIKLVHNIALSCATQCREDRAELYPRGNRAAQPGAAPDAMRTMFTN